MIRPLQPADRQLLLTTAHRGKVNENPYPSRSLPATRYVINTRIHTYILRKINIKGNRVKGKGIKIIYIFNKAIYRCDKTVK